MSWPFVPKFLPQIWTAVVVVSLCSVPLLRLSTYIWPTWTWVAFLWVFFPQFGTRALGKRHLTKRQRFLDRRARRIFGAVKCFSRRRLHQDSRHVLWNFLSFLFYKGYYLLSLETINRLFFCCFCFAFLRSNSKVGFQFISEWVVVTFVVVVGGVVVALGGYECRRGELLLSVLSPLSVAVVESLIERRIEKMTSKTRETDGDPFLGKEIEE